MVKDKSKKLALTAFTPNGDYLAILSPNGTAKIWNTNNGDLLAEWKPSNGDPGIQYCCIACSIIGKKHRKEQDTCLLALSTVDGDLLAFDAFTGERKWTTSLPCCVAGLSFADKGYLLRVVESNGRASEIKSENGELLKEFKISKKSISSLAFSHDEKYLAFVGTKLQVISWENGKEVLKFPDDLGSIQYVSVSSDAKALITSDFGGKNLRVWRCDLNSGSVGSGPTLSMRHRLLILECQPSCNGQDDLVVSAVSGSGAVYIWELKASSEDEVRPTISIKTNKVETDKENNERSKKSHASIIAFRVRPTGADKQLTAIVAYGFIDDPQFNVLNISDSEENIILNVTDEMEAVQEHGNPTEKVEAAVPVESKKAKKRPATSDPHLSTLTDKADFGADVGEVTDGVLLADNLNEPTMGEKLASLNLLDERKSKGNKEQETVIPSMPPSATSIHVLLKQALHADDRSLMLDCLYTQDEEVITNSISQLNPSNVLKLLHTLISIIESRGAILACALPWLKCLLLQHASGIMSQDSSLRALNSLYQLIESRVSTFKSAIQLSSCIDILYTGAINEEVEEDKTVPVIYEDEDDNEEESENAMETDQDSNDDEQSDEGAVDGFSDIEGADDMMSE